MYGIDYTQLKSHLGGGEAGVGAGTGQLLMATIQNTQPSMVPCSGLDGLGVVVVVVVVVVVAYH